jgi:predicted deacylase
VERFLMPLCDVVVDVHSSGDSLNYLPCAMTVAHADREEMNHRLALALAFGAPLLLISHSFEERNSSGAAKRAGTVRVGTEISGDATITMTVDGVMNVLRWAGILVSPEQAKTPEPRDFEILEVHPESDYVYALSSGMFEPAVRLGAVVETGDCAGYIHDTSRPLAEPDEVRFTSAGTVVCIRPSGPARRGDCLLHLATEPDSPIARQIASVERAFWGVSQSHSRGRQTPRR